MTESPYTIQTKYFSVNYICNKTDERLKNIKTRVLTSVMSPITALRSITASKTVSR